MLKSKCRTQFTNSANTKKCRQCPTQKQPQLRGAITTLLKNIMSLDTHPIFRSAVIFPPYCSPEFLPGGRRKTRGALARPFGRFDSHNRVKNGRPFSEEERKKTVFAKVSLIVYYFKCYCSRREWRGSWWSERTVDCGACPRA